MDADEVDGTVVEESSCTVQFRSSAAGVSGAGRILEEDLISSLRSETLLSLRA